MNCIEGGKFIMKKHFILFIFLLLLSYNVGCTSGDEKQKVSSEPFEENNFGENIDYLEEIHERYIEPLGLTRVIGVSWTDSSEVDSDSVLSIYMMKLYNEHKEKKYYIDYQFEFPADEVEAYTAKYFGMTDEKTRQAVGYNSKTQKYIVPEGIGGAWSVSTTGAEQTNDLLTIQYDLFDGQDQVYAHGEITIQIHDTDNYQYLSNSVYEINIDQTTSES